MIKKWNYFVSRPRSAERMRRQISVILNSDQQTDSHTDRVLIYFKNRFLPDSGDRYSLILHVIVLHDGAKFKTNRAQLQNTGIPKFTKIIIKALI